MGGGGNYLGESVHVHESSAFYSLSALLKIATCCEHVHDSG